VEERKMALPKKKHSQRMTRTRRSANDKVTVPSAAYCSYCGETKVPHRICPHCGYYKNRQVVAVKEYQK
jgi:large subunit ribosomal protein L32